MARRGMSRQPLPPGVSADQLVDLHEAAADWLVRRQSAGWSEADARALAAWLDERPLHREIFAGLARTRQLAAQLPLRAMPRPAVRPRRPWQALVPALAVLACVLLGGGWIAWDRTPRYQLSLATGPGETRQADLPDGSQVALNAGSRLEVRYYPRRRELALPQGEAFFRVAPDAQRPFSVDSGHSRVTVVGTAFNLHAEPSALVVQVQEGLVELRPDLRAAQGAVLRLGPGAGVAVDPATGRHEAVQVQAEAVGDWRSGHRRLLRVPLGQVAQQLARHLGRPVVLASPELAQLPVSGYLATAAPEGFLELLPDLVPVRVRRGADGGWTITRR